MNKEYLLKPVVEINDGDELKSFRIYNLFLVAFFFGLLPTLILCIRNCFWLRIKKPVIFVLTLLSILVLLAKYLILGSFYSANLEQLKGINPPETKSYSQSLSEKDSNDKTTKVGQKSPVISKWEQLKSNVITFERMYALLLLGAAYFLFRRKYKIVTRLIGNLQPLFKWAMVCVITSALLERVLSSLFFGGIL